MAAGAESGEHRGLKLADFLVGTLLVGGPTGQPRGCEFGFARDVGASPGFVEGAFE